MVAKEKKPARGRGRPAGQKDKKPRKMSKASLENLKKGAHFGHDQPADLNPGGRRKEVHRVSECILDLLGMPVSHLDDPVPPEMPLTVGQTIARVICVAACNGDDKAYRELLNRTEGKVPDEIIRRQAKLTSEEALDEYLKLEEEKKRILGEKY